MSNQDGKQARVMKRPANDDVWGWREYWKAHGQEWRTEPEIDREQQMSLIQRHRMQPNFGKGIYPFSEVKVTRADVEWMLATHEIGRGPIDLTGANLRGVNLSRLPLDSWFAHFSGGF